MDSWKEIALYLKRDVSTVQRWEKREGLPVHRHIHDKLGTVYAYKPELDSWWDNRRPQIEPQEKSRGPRNRRLWLAVGVTMMAAGGLAVLWRDRTRLHLPRVPAAPKHSEMVVRRVWAGPDVDALGTVSPDGRYLVYGDPATSDVAIRQIATGDQRRLTRKPPKARAGGALFPTFSPDGKQIAYSWDQAFFYDLRLIATDGSGERVLVQDPEVFLIEVADWTPDGRHILATFGGKDRTNRIVLVSVADGSVRTIKMLDSRSPSRMNFSPDGRYIAYDLPRSADSSVRDIFLLSVADGREIPLVEHRSGGFLLGWAPDGRTILFASDRTGTIDAWIIHVAQGKAQGEPVLVRRDIGRVWPVGFTRNGAYYYGVQTWKEEVYVARLNPVNGDLLSPPTPAARRLEGSNRSPDWSPDGLSLAYVSQRKPARVRSWPAPQIIIRNVQTADERDLWPKLNSVEMLRWSPDGRSFLATGYDRRDRLGVFRIDIQTGDAIPLVQSQEPRAFFHAPAWSPDGRTIFYKLRDVGMEPAPLFVRDLQTGRERQVLASVYRFDVSRDGKWLAFCSFDEESEFLRIKPTAGGEPRELYREARSGRIYSVAWTPDRRHLLFAKKGQLWRIPVEGGEPEKLPLNMEALRELRVHPDGTQITFTAGTGKGEVWVMENFLPEP